MSIDRTTYHSLTIAEVIQETADTRSFVLEIPPALENVFDYRAGQFCTFRTTLDGEEVVRCYSMSSSPEAADRFKTTAKRVVEGRMSNWMNDALSAGDTIEVMPPAGLFVLHDRDEPIVAFAGGSGITPIISIIKTALCTTQRDIVLVYANRDADSIIFKAELDRLSAGSGGRLSVHHHLDSEKGFLDSDACVQFVGDRGNADFYVCGPGPYMDTVEAGLDKLGVAEDRFFIERFALADDDVESAEIEPAEVGEATQEITFMLEGRKQTADYTERDTILQAARRAGLKPPFSCEAGNCGACMGLVKKGGASMHLNNALTPDEVEEGWVLTCQAVPSGREVLVDYDA